MKYKTCKIKECNNPIWSNGLCKNHTIKKPIKKISKKVYFISKENEIALNKAITSEYMHKFFMKIWNERKHISEVSGTFLGKEALSTFFHHILPKNKYWEAALDPENIILLTTDEHATVENNMYIFEEVNKRREQLLKKYNLI